MQPTGSFYTLCKSFDFARKGAIGLDSFIAMAMQLKGAKKYFEAFQPDAQGKVSLDFNQYVWSLAQI